MFCAPSGGGKSVMLINLVKNAVDRNLQRNDDRRAIYIYVSLENLIDESLIRLYSCLSNKTTESIINNYDEERYLIPKTIKNWLNDNNSIIKFLYMKPQYTNCFDIMSEVNDIKTQNPNCDVKAIYIDYLDLMKPNITSRSNDAYRLELGQISIDMKTLAVLLRVPIITCTQVNRAGYDPKNKMNLTNIGESMKKVDNSDWICMMQPKEDDDEKSGSHGTNFDLKDMDLKITKSRFGHKDVSVPFRTNFSKFRFEEIRKNSGLDIDVNLNEMDQRTIVSDKITKIQNERYDLTEESESMDMSEIDGFV
jgi:replicative DNA helicase